MISDTELKMSGFKILTENLGEVLTERFIALVQREKFDYTKWQKELWKDKTVEEISEMAMKKRREQE